MSKDPQDAALIARVMEWWKDLPHSKPQHAKYSVFLARGYLECCDTPDEEAVFWLAIAHCVWWWLDDRSEHCGPNDEPLDWEGLYAAFERPESVAESSNADIGVMRRINEGMTRRARAALDINWWRTTMVETIRAFRFTEETAKHGISLVEYLELSLWNCCVRSLLATTSLLGGLDLATRRGELWVANLDRYMCLDARLENDVHSLDVERKLGSKANAVLLMEQALPPAAALAFVEEQRAGLVRLIDQGCALLGPSDPIARLITSVQQTHRRWYQTRPSRYQ